MERTASDHPVFAVIGVLNEAGKYTYTDGLAAKGYPLDEVVYPDMLAVRSCRDRTPRGAPAPTWKPSTAPER